MNGNFSDNNNTLSDNNEEFKSNNSGPFNLTENRILILFIIFIVVISIIFFGFFIFIKNFKSNVSITSTTIKNDNNNLTYYENLTENSKQNFVDESIEKSKEQTNDIVKEPKKESVKIDLDSAQNNIKLDNSSIIYSSKFNRIRESENNISENKKNNSNVNKQPIIKQSTIKEKEQNITQKVKENKIKSNNEVNNIRYVIQIASYSNLKNAQEVESYYKKIGYPAYIKEYNLNGKIYYRLRIGPFKEKNKAQEYLISLKNSKYGKNSFISKVNI